MSSTATRASFPSPTKESAASPSGAIETLAPLPVPMGVSGPNEPPAGRYSACALFVGFAISQSTAAAPDGATAMLGML